MSDQPSQSHQEAEGSHIAQAAEEGVAIVIDGNDNVVYYLSPAQAQEWRDLKTLLAKVKSFWIEGFLKKSLYNEVLLHLGKETRLDAVEHPWERVVEIKDKPRQSLSPEAKISDVFDEMNRAMLILGEPGSGKTITLLELARCLINQAEQDPTYSQPVPVVFNLSSWPGKSKDILEWLVEELSQKYSIPNKLGRKWLESRRILPLLDGLDEMPKEYRASCVEAINTLKLPGLAVCCRYEEYIQIPVQLKFNGAIYLQPLTPEQVDGYLANVGPELTGIRTLLKSDEDLLSLSQTPLMLNIMTLAYVGASADELAKQVESPSNVQKHLFDTYVERMFARKGISSETFPYGQSKKWLSWIAQKLISHDQSIFLIENLQPIWLEKDRQQLGYSYKLLVGLSSRQQLYYKLLVGLSSGMLWVLFCGLIFGLMIGLMFGMSAGLMFGLVVGPIYGLGCVLAVLVYSVLFVKFPIKPVEVITWSWRRAINTGLLYALYFGLLGALTYWLISSIEEFRLRLNSEQVIYLFGLLGGLLGGLTGGRGSVEISEKTIPNQGIRQSAKNAIIGGLLGGLIGGLIGGLLGGSILWEISDPILFKSSGPILWGINGLILWEIDVPIGRLVGETFFRASIGLIFGLSFGYFGALIFGGNAVIRHLSLRLLLWKRGCSPFRLIPFLNFCVDRIFLRRVGGGYIFIHRMLMEHFADMEFDTDRKDLV